MSDQGGTWWRGVGAVVGAMVAALLATLAVGSSAWGQGGPIMYPEGERAAVATFAAADPEMKAIVWSVEDDDNGEVDFEIGKRGADIQTAAGLRGR